MIKMISNANQYEVVIKDIDEWYYLDACPNVVCKKNIGPCIVGMEGDDLMWKKVFDNCESNEAVPRYTVVFKSLTRKQDFVIIEATAEDTWVIIEDHLIWNTSNFELLFKSFSSIADLDVASVLMGFLPHMSSGQKEQFLNEYYENFDE